MGKSTIVLLVVLLGLVGVYQFYLKEKPVNITNSDTSAPSVEPSITLFSGVKSDITRISWRFSNTQYGTLEQYEDGKWRLLDPTTVQLDESKADAFAGELIALTGTPRIGLNEQFKLTDVGLEPVTGSITLEKKGGSKEVLRVGNSAIGDSQVYVHKEGTDFATLVYAYQISDLKKQPSDLGPDPSPSPTP